MICIDNDLKNSFDPFYSEQNQARLRKSIAQMEAANSTDSLTGILQGDGDIDKAKAERLAEKY